MIKQNTTTSFTVSIAQEERVDTLTYEVALRADGGVDIVSRSPGSNSK